MNADARAVTFLFSDIEGSTRLWEEQPERMRPALARHDVVCREAVWAHRGRIVKTTGDGVHAVFDQPPDALAAMLALQLGLADLPETHGVTFRVRCGLHLGSDEQRDNDYYGPAVNRAARIMSVAHGGQMLLSQAVKDRLGGSVPDGVSLRELGAVRLRDLDRPEWLYQVVHPALRIDFPPLRSLEATPNNLPQQLNSFVGRERELVEVRELLSRHRLVNLLGLGGVGKSRLSVQLGADLIDDYPDGVWLVELAPVSDAQLVPQALASVLGVQEEAGRPVIEALLRHVRDRRLLVVLDNCEHVVHACADLARQLLAAAPRVTILASSREVLRIAAEAVYHVPTLAVPAATDRPDAASLGRLEAVRLFVDRAVAAQPAFVLGASNAAAVADICRRLDGIPLALELAAARTRSIPVQTLAARLDDRFRLLKTQDQTVLPRQRTLRALIDWSYDLLGEPERLVFQRLSVFAGGWTVEAAEAVCAGGSVDGLEVLDLLGQLVEKSLVSLEAEGGRYRLLETVRQYAEERATASGEQARARAAHLAHYARLAEDIRLALAGPQQGRWLRVADLERENVLAAHAAGADGADSARTVLRMLDALRGYWSSRGLVSLALRLTLDALARPGTEARDTARCYALTAAGQYCLYMGRDAEAAEHLAESLAIARETGSATLTADALRLLGWTRHAQGDIAAATAHLEEALAAMRDCGTPSDIALAANQLAQLYRAQGRLDDAQPLYESALALMRQQGDDENAAVGLLNLAMVAVGRNAPESARQHLREVLTIAEALGSQGLGQCALDVCAGLAAARADWAASALFHGAAQSQLEAMGLRRDPADETFVRPGLAATMAALGETACAQAQAAGRTLSLEVALARAAGYLAPPAGAHVTG